MSDSWSVGSEIQDEPEQSSSARKEGFAKEKKNGGMQKGHRNQPKIAPNGQSWEIMSNKLNYDGI